MNKNNACITNYDQNNIKAIDAFIGSNKKEHNLKQDRVIVTKASRKKCASALLR